MKKKRGLTTRILLAMAAGFAFGIGINAVGNDGFVERWIVDGALRIGAEIFLASLGLLVVPLVFVSLSCGTASMNDIARIGRIGGKTLALYLATTALAISLAMTAALVVAPGEGFELTAPATFEAKASPPLVDTLIGIFPSNPVRAMAEGNMLQIVVFSILFGLAMALSGAPGKRLLSTFQDLNEVVLRLVMLLMALAPIGVFCLIARVIAGRGISALGPLAAYFFTVLGVLFLHALGVYPLLLRLLSGLSPVQFLRRFREVLAVAFSTSSSNATLPVTLEVTEKKLGVHNSIAAFTIPLGATINMDGTAIMQGVATIFIAQAYGVPLGTGDLAAVVVTATLASIGTAGVPGVGLVMLAMVLRQVHLPVEGIGLILGVDRLLDMTRTAVNVTGDAVVSCIVAKSEGMLRKDVFAGSDDPA